MLILQVCVEGKSGVSFWHDYARDRGEAEKLTRKRIQELIKEGIYSSLHLPIS